MVIGLGLAGIAPAAADVGEHRGQKIFVWPGPATGDLESRKADLAEQIRQYSRYAGSMRTARVSTTHPLWENRLARMERLRPRSCAGVRQTLIDTFFDDSINGFYQYGNCGEGALVTICLAKHYGFPKSDVLHCQNRYKTSDPDAVPRIKHQFGLVKIGDSWCLLDRWNRFQDGLKLEPILRDGRHATAEHDPKRKLYRLTTPKGGSYFAGPRVSEEIEACPPPYW